MNGKITNRLSNNKESMGEKLLQLQKFCSVNINKDKPTEKDIEKFFQDLVIKDKIKIEKYNKQFKKKTIKNYSDKSKKEFIEHLEKYLKWKFPKNPKLLIPLKIKISNKKNDIKTLSQIEVDKLRKGCDTAEKRALISILYGNGCRAEELINIRFEDVTLPKGEESFVKIRLKNEYSKTEGRTITNYYVNALEDIRELFEERKEEGIKLNEPIFRMNYEQQRHFLRRLGEKVLKKNIHHHLFRHSCASVMASKLNRQQLCIYFGWKFSSPMPDIYIRREAVDMQDVEEKFKSTELEELKVKLSKQEYETKLRNEEFEGLKEKVEQLDDLKKRMALLEPLLKKELVNKNKR